MIDRSEHETEVAQVLRQLVAKASPTVRSDLRRLLENSLADPPAAIERNRALGLMVRLALVDGELPEEPAYERARKAAAAEHGEDWPSARSLRRRYGSWTATQVACGRLLSHRYPKVVQASSYAFAYDHPAPGTYTPEAVHQALISFWKAKALWPTQWEFQAWARARRGVRAAGKPLPLLPTRQVHPRAMRARSPMPWREPSCARCRWGCCHGRDGGGQVSAPRPPHLNDGFGDSAEANPGLGASPECHDEGSLRFYVLRAHPASVLWAGLRSAVDQGPPARPVVAPLAGAILDVSTLRYTLDKDDPAETWSALRESRRGRVMLRLRTLFAPALPRFPDGLAHAHPMSVEGVVRACDLSEEEYWAARWLAVCDYAFAQLHDWPTYAQMTQLHATTALPLSSAMPRATPRTDALFRRVSASASPTLNLVLKWIASSPPARSRAA